MAATVPQRAAVVGPGSDSVQCAWGPACAGQPCGAAALPPHPRRVDAQLRCWGEQRN
ncbi:MAG: hypothetical protein LBE67_04680 [Kocuria palustris]|nr:hypothetical protein [Kocuria palustris]